MALVFVLDDEVTTRAIYARTLARMRGISFVMAASLDEARQMLEGLSPDLCILDLRLPDGNGLELLEILSTKAKSCPVAVVSDFVEDVPESSGYPSSLEVFRKPPPVDKLRALIWSTMEGLARRGAFTLPEYIQLACMGGHSVALDVWSGDMVGQVQIVTGQIWAARYGESTGFGALSTMLHESDLHVLVHRKEFASGPRQMAGDWQGLLIEAARLHDEERRSRSDSIVPEELDFSDVFEEVGVSDIVAAPASERDVRQLVEAGVKAVIRRDYEEAARSFEAALELRPFASEVRHRLDRLREIMGK